MAKDNKTEVLQIIHDIKHYRPSKEDQQNQINWLYAKVNDLIDRLEEDKIDHYFIKNFKHMPAFLLEVKSFNHEAIICSSLSNQRESILHHFNSSYDKLNHLRIYYT